MNSHALSPDFIADYLGNMESSDCLACMSEMLKFNRQNIQPVVNVAVKNLNALGAGNIVKMFESVGSFDGIFFFLGTACFTKIKVTVYKERQTTFSWIDFM